MRPGHLEGPSAVPGPVRPSVSTVIIITIPIVIIIYVITIHSFSILLHKNLY